MSEDAAEWRQRNSVQPTHYATLNRPDELQHHLDVGGCFRHA